MKYKLIPRRLSLLIYEDDDPVNYVASCQLNINGNKCTIDTLNGEKFYKFLKEVDIVKLFEDIGVSELGIAVSEAHYRLILRELRHKNINIVKQDSFNFHSIKLNWVVITPK